MTSKVFSSGTVIDSAWLNDVNVATYVTVSNQTTKLSNIVDVVSDFGADPTGVTDSTSAFQTALATLKNVTVPQGSYLVSGQLNIANNQCMFGSGKGRTTIRSSASGSGTASSTGGCCIYIGNAGNPSYNSQLKDITLISTNLTVVAGVMLDALVYYTIDNVEVIGAGVVASANLSGWGIYITNNSIIGRINQARVWNWNFGLYAKCEASSQSTWVAALTIGGQSEFSSNIYPIVIGDPTINFYNAGISIRDVAIQSNLKGGILVYNGENVVIDACYFESNALYDVNVGTGSGAPTTVGVKIINCYMTSADFVTASGTNPYGVGFNLYAEKITVTNSNFCTIRDNDISCPTSVPCIVLTGTANQTLITGNRLNTPLGTNLSVTDGGVLTTIVNNFPNPQGKFQQVPTPNTSATYTVVANDVTLLCSNAGTMTLTLPIPSSSNYGRVLRIVNYTGQLINNNVANVIRIANSGPAVLISNAVAGQWVEIQNNGTNWVTIASGSIF